MFGQLVFTHRIHSSYSLVLLRWSEHMAITTHTHLLQMEDAASPHRYAHIDYWSVFLNEGKCFFLIIWSYEYSFHNKIKLSVQKPLHQFSLPKPAWCPKGGTLRGWEIRKEEGVMWGKLEFHPGHLADKQRLRPPHGPIAPYGNLLHNRLFWILDPVNT